MDELIKELIDSTGLIPTRLAEEVGVDRTTIYTWKNMEKMISGDHLINLIKIAVDSGNITPSKVMDLIINARI